MLSNDSSHSPYLTLLTNVYLPAWSFKQTLDNRPLRSFCNEESIIINNVYRFYHFANDNDRMVLVWSNGEENEIQIYESSDS